MSLEPGGRADKYGNKYENRYLAKLLIRLIRGDLTSIVVEPLGPNHDSVEYITEQKDGTTKHYQCKASNGTSKYWSYSDLAAYDVFTRARDIINQSSKNLYYFISPLPYGELSELCKRSRTNQNAQEFTNFQLTNKDIRAYYDDIAKNLGLNKDSSIDQETLRIFFSKCYFELYSAGAQSQEDLEEIISVTLTGNQATIRNLLENYATDKDCLGTKIIAPDLIAYLSEKGFFLRNYKCSENVNQRINTINTDYYGVYPAVNDQLFHRSATENILQHLKNGKSVIVHGKAGSGKSGCLQEVREFLEKESIPYISIKLDTKPPQGSADEYGKTLGLPESPIASLATLAAGKPAVLILDQLDALRWTNSHSSDALSVCKELITQCRAINTLEDGHLSIIFASRTFDLENDSGLQSLFASKAENDQSMWDKVNVGLLTSDELSAIIGPRYNQFSNRMKKLLLTPSSLYVWSKLDDETKNHDIASVQVLMETWWKQILRQCQNACVEEINIINCKDKLVKMMDDGARFALPLMIFSDFDREIDALVSSGLLNKNKKLLSFSHQSFLDYFITKESLKRVFMGEDITDIIWKYNEQTPFVRYRLLALLQAVVDTDINMFLLQASNILESSQVRYYFKCTVFEIIGQIQDPDESIYEFIDTYYSKDDWKEYIRQVVLLHHPQYIKRIPVFSKNEWFNDEDLELLRSVVDNEPDFVAVTLAPFVTEENKEQNRKIWSTIYHDVSLDSDSLFTLRKKLFKLNPDLFNHSRAFIDLINQKSIRVIDLINMVLNSWPIFKGENIYLGNPKEIQAFTAINSKELITQLIPKVLILTKEFSIKWPNTFITSDFREWTHYEYNNSAVRKIIELIKDALKVAASDSPDFVVQFIGTIDKSQSAIAQELIMHAFTNLPTPYADTVLNWILEDFNKRIFVYTANPDDYLSYAKDILKKFSPCCSNDVLQKIERKIYSWSEHPSEMISQLQRRINTNKCKKGRYVYNSYWGHMQKALFPYLDGTRKAKYIHELENVLNRNKWINLNHFYSGFSFESFGPVASPIDHCLDSISDITWLHIIKTPNNKMKGIGKKNNELYVEANHDSFSNSMAMQTKKQPARFVKLALRIPKGSYNGYIYKLFYALADIGDPIEQDLINQLIIQSLASKDRSITLSILHYIRKMSNLTWPKEILDLIKQLADNTDPSPNEFLNTDKPTDEDTSFTSIYNKSLNCIRGCVVHTVAALLWSHKDLFSYFRSTCEQLICDSNAAVRLASTAIILPYSNFDTKFAANANELLVLKDIRVICTREWQQIMLVNYFKNSNFYRNILIKATKSAYTDAAITAAKLLCAVAIFKDDKIAYEYVTTSPFTEEQQQSISRQAISSFNSEKYHDISQEILVNLIRQTEKELSAVGQLFYNNLISIKRDAHFLHELMASAQSKYICHHFLDYLLKSDEDIKDYADIIKTLATHVFTDYDSRYSLFFPEDLIKCVIRLFDRGKNDHAITRICLDIWDELFKSNLHCIRPISDMIDFLE